VKKENPLVFDAHGKENMVLAIEILFNSNK